MFFVLLLRNPDLLEGSKRCENRTTDPSTISLLDTHVIFKWVTRTYIFVLHLSGQRRPCISCSKTICQWLEKSPRINFSIFYDYARATIVVHHHSITSWLVSNLQIRAAIARSIHSVTFQWNWGTMCCHQLRVRCSRVSLFESANRCRSLTRKCGSCARDQFWECWAESRIDPI